MAQTLIFNDSSVELQIDTSTGSNDLLVTGEEGQRVVKALRNLKVQIPLLRRVAFDIPGSPILGRVGFWVDEELVDAPRILYVLLEDLTLADPEFYYEFHNGSWTEQEIANVNELVHALLVFNSTHVLTTVNATYPVPDTVDPFEDLFAYYPMDEVAGNRVDTFGSNDLVAVGTPGFVTGKEGNAVSTADSADYLDFTGTDFRPTSFLTYSFWFYISANFDSSGDVFTIAAALNPVGPAYDYRFIATGSGFPQLAVQVFESPFSSSQAQLSIQYDQWNHAIVEIDVSGKRARLTVNAIEGAYSSPLGGPITTTSTDLYVCTTTGTAAAYTIAVDEMAVFFAELSEAKKLALYNYGLGRFY